MTYEVRETPEAKRVHEKVLKGAARKRYEAFLTDLAAQGCKAGGKRLRPALVLIGCEHVGGQAEEALGAAVLGGCEDLAQARLTFVNGCVANETASRVSLKTERKLRIFQDDAYLSLDLQQKILTVIRKRPGVPAPGELPVTIEERNFEQGDALREEILAFLLSIRTGAPPKVSGEDGLRALETAIRISEQVHAGRR